jgi:DNA-binding NarL/FixJ family response regulator
MSRGGIKMSKGVHIVIADDNTLYHGAVHAAFADREASVAITQCENFVSLKKALTKGQPATVVLLEVSITGMGGLRGILALRSIAPGVPLVIVSEVADAKFINRAIELGANGFIAKAASASQLRKAIDTVAAGGSVMVPNVDLSVDEDDDARHIISQFKSLTRQQARVLGYLGEGLLNKQIAYELTVSEATVKAHVSAILQKLNVDSRTQAVATIVRLSPSSNQYANN